jgi:hypothetical protein
VGSPRASRSVVLTGADSSWWDVRAVDERVLGELRRHYPDATDL